MSTVVPVDSIASRMPIVGKIKAGVYKNGRPQAIDTWRLTTSDKRFAELFAERYGGTVEPMTNQNSPHKWEVTSDASELSIALIGEKGYSIQYELWKQGGCQRRCDGVTAEVLQTTGPDDVEYVPSPCLCDRKGVLECDLKSRLTLLLPDLPFAGGVLYESGSKNFAEESQGMLNLLSQMQSNGVTRGVLRLEQRRSSGNRKFTIAVVGVTESPEAIASGMAGMRSLGRADDNRPELAAGDAPPPAAPRGSGDSPAPGPHSSSSPQGVAGEDRGVGPHSTSGTAHSVADHRPIGASVRDPHTPPQTSSEVGAVTGEGSASASEEHELKETAGNFKSAPQNDDGDDIVDAEIVDEGPESSEPTSGDSGDETLRLDPAERSRFRAAFMARAKGLGLDYNTQIRPWIGWKYEVAGGWSELSDSQAYSLYHALIVPDGTREQKDDAERRFKAAVEEHAEVTA